MKRRQACEFSAMTRLRISMLPGMPVTADITVGPHTVLNELLGRGLAVASEGMREPSRVKNEGTVCSMRHMAVWRPLERVQAVFSPTAALRRGTTLMAAGKTGPAFQLYARAGRTGLAEAEYRVGRCYLDGVGVPPSRPKGYVGLNGRRITATSRPNRSSQSSTSMARRARRNQRVPRGCSTSATLQTRTMLRRCSARAWRRSRAPAKRRRYWHSS